MDVRQMCQLLCTDISVQFNATWVGIHCRLDPCLLRTWIIEIRIKSPKPLTMYMVSILI